MTRRLVVGSLAAVLLVLGTAVLVAYVRTAEDRALAGEETTEVLVAARDISAGTSFRDLHDAVEVAEVPMRVRAAGAVADLGTLEGLVASTDLVAGEQLIRGRFVSPEDLGTFPIPDGMLSVATSLSPERALGGQLRPGDTVAVIASFGPTGQDGSASTSQVILDAVLVTGVQRPLSRSFAPGTDGASDGDDPTRAPDGDLLVTLAVGPPEAQRLVFALEHGAIWLAGQPSTTSVPTAATVTAQDVLP
jgi:pilus assembly protein CpaB